VRNSSESRFRDSPIRLNRVISCEGAVHEVIRYRNSYRAVMVPIVQDLGEHESRSPPNPGWQRGPADAFPPGLERL
jgi:hypothetical protein